jgi:hypothetical protein
MKYLLIIAMIVLSYFKAQSQSYAEFGAWSVEYPVNSDSFVVITIQVKNIEGFVSAILESSTDRLNWERRIVTPIPSKMLGKGMYDLRLLVRPEIGYKRQYYRLRMHDGVTRVHDIISYVFTLPNPEAPIKIKGS